MKILKILLVNTKKTITITLAALPLMACAEMMKDPGTSDPGAPDGRISDFQFSIGTNKDGSILPIVRTKDGAKLNGERIPRNESVKASAIEEIETITIIRAKGSHYILVDIAGVLMKFDLAHP